MNAGATVCQIKRVSITPGFGRKRPADINVRERVFRIDAVSAIGRFGFSFGVDDGNVQFRPIVFNPGRIAFLFIVTGATGVDVENAHGYWIVAV